MSNQTAPDLKLSVGQRDKKYFSKYRKPILEMPNLFDGQLSSFEWLLKDGIKEVFSEFASIKDYSEKKFELKFVDFVIDPPKLDDRQAKNNKLTYEAQLKVTAKLLNKALGTEKQQEIFLADFPLMTNRGTFIINGVERVVVPQLARLYGILFNSQLLKGHRVFGAKIIPARGAWIELESDLENIIYARVDRNRKFPVTTLLRILGAHTDEQILKLCFN